MRYPIPQITMAIPYARLRLPRPTVWIHIGAIKAMKQLANKANKKLNTAWPAKVVHIKGPRALIMPVRRHDDM